MIQPTAYTEQRHCILEQTTPRANILGTMSRIFEAMRNVYKAYRGKTDCNLLLVVLRFLYYRIIHKHEMDSDEWMVKLDNIIRAKEEEMSLPIRILGWVASCLRRFWYSD